MQNWGGAAPELLQLQRLPSCTDLVLPSSAIPVIHFFQSFPPFCSLKNHCFRRAVSSEYFGSPSLWQDRYPQEDEWLDVFVISTRNLFHLQSSLQVLINCPLSMRLQAGIISPIFTAVETKVERCPSLRPQKKLVTQWMSTGVSDLALSVRLGCSRRSICPRSSHTAFCSWFVQCCRVRATGTRLVHLSVSPRNTRDADCGSWR